MSESRGHFVWYELATTEGARAAEFYRTVVGWRAAPAGTAHPDYTILSAGETPIGGIAELPAATFDGGATPGWIGYIGVDDVDAFAAAVIRAGGHIRRIAEDIPGIGRFAVAADPQGARFTLFTPFGDQAAAAPGGATPGRVGWHELHAADRDSAFAFYADLFGWTKTDAIDMGPMGIYQTFATGGPTGDGMVGGMMTKAEAMPAPTWLYYVNVDDTSAAVARIKEAGGQVVNGPHQVPGGSWIAQGVDPQGSMFAVVGPNSAA
ncbi:MAG TPA: VOC family protein [Rhodopila sp.]|jgi:hypothetical protein